MPHIPFDPAMLVGSSAPPEPPTPFESSRPSPSKKARSIGPDPRHIPHLPLHRGYPIHIPHETSTMDGHDRFADYPLCLPTTLMMARLTLSPTAPLSAVPIPHLSQPQSRTSSPRHPIKPFIPPPGSTYRAELSAPALTESHRRTEALLRLQSQETDMPDEDLVEIMAEFEANLAAADTYLAIQRASLRKMYLAKLLTRIKRDGR